jgi:hypothetical protein
MSRMVKTGNPIRGWTELLDGEEEMPLPSASTKMTK